MKLPPSLQVEGPTVGMVSRITGAMFSGVEWEDDPIFHGGKKAKPLKQSFFSVLKIYQYSSYSYTSYTSYTLVQIYQLYQVYILDDLLPIASGPVRGFSFFISRAWHVQNRLFYYASNLEPGVVDL